MRATLPAATGLEGTRIRAANTCPPRGAGDYVLYWMTAARRVHDNFALERAAAWAAELGKPLLVLEALRADYRWASWRFTRFVLDGMKDNADDLAQARVAYLPYVEPEVGAARGLLHALAARAAVVVTDEYPAGFLPRMVAAAAARLPVLLEVVDGNGVLPLRAAEQIFVSAHSFRRFLHKELPPHLLLRPARAASGLAQLLRLDPASLAPILARWPMAAPSLLAGDAQAERRLPGDRKVEPVAERGGRRAAEATLARFVRERLSRYAEARNHPDEDVASGLSPYLHWGHLSPHRALAHVLEAEGWDPGRLSRRAHGQREGWWGLSAGAESFLDELITWRELGFNLCARREDYDRYESLPGWAQKTLDAHRADVRPHLYSLGALEAAETHDPLWNAAARQLRAEGRIHNYLRMLWGKKILEWSPSPEEALARMIELNNKYALDGRDPNSYSGIFWVLGRYDRPWAPARPVFGVVRYMSSENAQRKLRLKSYLERYRPDPLDRREEPRALPPRARAPRSSGRAGSALGR